MLIIVMIIISVCVCGWVSTTFRTDHIKRFYDIFQIKEMVKYWLLISLILINIVGQASLDDQSTICQVSIRLDAHTDTADTRCESGPFVCYGGYPLGNAACFVIKCIKFM